MNADVRQLEILAGQALAARDWEMLGQLCRKMKSLPGGQPVAQHWQALMAVQQGDVAEGIRLLRMVVRQVPGHGVAARQLAKLLADGKDFAGAVAVLRGHVAVAPTDADSVLGLAEMAWEAGDFEMIPAQIAFLDRVAPGVLPNPKLFGWRWRCMTTLAAKWPDANDLGLVNPAPRDRAQMWFWLMMKAWLVRDAGGLDTAAVGLNLALNGTDGQGRATFTAAGPGKVRFVMGSYMNMLQHLARHNGMPPAPVSGAKRLWVVGESHSLPAHGQVVEVRGEVFQADSVLVAGLKYWHLASGRGTSYASLLRHWLGQLPASEPVLLSLGEVDVREDEGMWLQLLKGRNMEEVVASTIGGGMARLRAMVDEVCPGREVWVSGIPQRMPGRLYAMEAHQKDLYVAMRLRARDVLEQAAAAYGFGVAPLWDGTADDAAFLPDAVHLQPRVLMEAWAHAKASRD